MNYRSKLNYWAKLNKILYDIDLYIFLFLKYNSVGFDVISRQPAVYRIYFIRSCVHISG